MSTTLSHKNLWEEVLKRIEKEVSGANFKTWFRDTFIIKYDDGVVFVGVPNTFVKDWLIKKFQKLILKVLRDVNPEIRSLEFNVSKSERVKKNQEKPVFINSDLNINDYYVSKDTNLNPRYTFENFVIGPFNELAHSASCAVMKQPGVLYNPLFIYGNTGHGKTHLIQAIGNYIKQNSPEKNIYYVSSDSYYQEYSYSVQNGKINSFKDKYKKYDVLIIDDIQFLSNKEKTQEELFHLFNNLYENNKQIIFSSDKHPNFIPNLEDRLKSRFNQGMIVDIPAPDHESRLAILKNKATRSNLFLPEQTIEFLAQNIAGNIRELEGVINSIVCHTQLKGRDLNITEIRDVIKDIVKPKKMISVDDLIKIISDFYNVDEKSIREKTRRKEIVRPRQIVMYLLREDFNVSFPTIGEKLGGRDHTTVIHSYERVKEELKIDHSLSQQINQIRTMF